MSKITGLYPPTSDPNYQKVYKEKNRERLYKLWKAKRDLRPRYHFYREPAEFNEAIALYQSGLSVRDCQKRTGVNHQTLLSEMRRRGIATRPQKRYGPDNPLWKGGAQAKRVWAKNYMKRYSVTYYLKNKQRISRRRRKRPVEVIRASNRKSYHRNKHKYIARRLDYQFRRKAWEKSTPSDARGIESYMTRTKSSASFTCYYCQRIFSSLDVTFDHVFPFNRKGPHSLWNLCTACGFCNSSKCDSLISEWKTTGQLMLEL